MTRTDRFSSYLFRTTLVNWGVSGLTILYALFITPIAIHALDKSMYGVWSFLNGLLAYSNLLYLGLGTAFVKYLSEYRAVDDWNGASRLTSVVLFLYSAIGILSLLGCIALAPYIPLLMGIGGDAGVHGQVVTAWMLLGGRLLLMFLAAVFSGVLVATERMTAAGWTAIAGTAVRFIAVPLLIHSASPLTMLALIVTVTAALETFALVLQMRHFAPRLRISLVVPTRPELKRLYGFGIQSFFVQLSGLLVNYTDTTVIGIRLGASSVAFYSIPLQLVAYGRVAVQGISSALLPRLTAYASTGNRAALSESYPRVSRITNYVAAFVAMNLIIVGPTFMRLWVGEEFARAGTVSLILLAIAGYCQTISTVTAIQFFQAMHALVFPVVILTLEAVLNLVFSIWLAPSMGITGVAVATLVPTALITLVWLPWYLCQQLALRPTAFIRVAVAPSIVLGVAIFVANELADVVAPISSYALAAARVSVNAAIAAVVFVATFPPDDRASLLELVAPWRKRAAASVLS
jgi:O-antigen/teichoic acid export membrane protein